MTPETVTSEITAPKGKAKAFIFSLLTLLSGIIIGSSVTLIVVGPEQQPNDLPGPEFFSRRMIEHWTGELNLTPEQVSQMHPIAEKHMKALDDYRKEAQPKIRAEIDAMNNEIMDILDDQQRQMFKDHVERMKRHFQEMRERGDDGSDRRGDGPRGEGPQRNQRGERGNWRRGPRDGSGDPNAPQFPPRPNAEDEMNPNQPPMEPADQTPPPNPDQPQ